MDDGKIYQRKIPPKITSLKILISFFKSAGQEQQKIFKAVYPMDHSKVEEKLVGFGWSSVNGIDPNPENFCGAGIITTSSGQFGCLYRLEPNNQAQVRDSFKVLTILEFIFSDVSFNNTFKS